MAHFLDAKLMIDLFRMAIFHSYDKLPEGFIGIWIVHYIEIPLGWKAISQNDDHQSIFIGIGISTDCHYVWILAVGWPECQP